MGGIVNKMKGNPEDKATNKNTNLNVEMDGDMELRQAVYQKPARKLGGVWREALRQPIQRKERPPERIVWKEMVEQILYDNYSGGLLVRTGSGNLSQQIEAEDEIEDVDAEEEEEEEEEPLGKKHFYPLAGTEVQQQEEEEEDDEGSAQIRSGGPRS